MIVLRGPGDPRGQSRQWLSGPTVLVSHTNLLPPLTLHVLAGCVPEGMKDYVVLKKITVKGFLSADIGGQRGCGFRC